MYSLAPFGRSVMLWFFDMVVRQKVCQGSILLSLKFS